MNRRPLHPLFGLEIGGARLAAEIGQAIGEAGLLLIRDVKLSDEQLAAFAGSFGPLQNMSGKVGERRDIIRVSNVDDEGRMKAADASNRLQHDANLLWHMDSSYLSPGASLSFLLAQVVPENGGDTEFCDTRIAWEALPRERQQALLPLWAEHSMFHSWRQVGVEMSEMDRSRMPPVRRRLVRPHSPSGRMALVIPSHVERIEGLDVAQTQALRADLEAVAADPARVYRHKWRPGDLLIWDNRCMLHRATPYAAFEEPRDLHSCRVLDIDDDGVALAA